MKPQVQHLKPLTGLRFLAALAVFVHHVGGHMGISRLSFPLGAMAVSFFFVLSGFILTYVYHGRLKRSGLKRFYFSRWARIWPLHAVCLILFLTLLPLGAAKHSWSQLFFNAALLQSWIPDTGYVFSYSAPAWSISTELFFYACFPLFLLGGPGKFRKLYAGLIVVTAGLVIGLSYLDTLPAFASVVDSRLVVQANPVFRLLEFCTGMGMGYLFLARRDSKSVEVIPAVPDGWKKFTTSTLVESLAIALIPLFVMASAYFKVIYTLERASWAGPVFGAWFQYTGAVLVFSAVIFVFAGCRGFWSRVFGSRIMVFLGEVSFSFYMVHVMVIRMVKKTDWAASGMSPVLIGTCTFLICLGLSIILYRMVEIPARNILLGLYDGKYRDVLRTAVNIVLDTFRKPVVATGMAFVCLPALVLYVNYDRPVYTPEMRAIIAQTPLAERGQVFDNGLKMLGFSTSPRPAAIEIRVVWQRTSSSLCGKRVTYVLNESAELVGRGPVQKPGFFLEQPVGHPFIETVVVNERIFESDSLITFGFVDEQRKRVRIIRGPTPLDRYQLPLVSAERIAELEIERQEMISARK